jgi:hypothetical protein
LALSGSLSEVYCALSILREIVGLIPIQKWLKATNLSLIKPSKLIKCYRFFESAFLPLSKFENFINSEGIRNFSTIIE